MDRHCVRRVDHSDSGRMRVDLRRVAISNARVRGALNCISAGHSHGSWLQPSWTRYKYPIAAPGWLLALPGEVTSDVDPDLLGHDPNIEAGSSKSSPAVR